MNEKKIKGTTIIPGVGYGNAYYVGRIPRTVEEKKIELNQVDEQLQLFNHIREKAKNIYTGYLESYRRKAPPGKDADILNIYILLLDDPAFVTEVATAVSDKLFSLDSAIKSVSNSFIDRFNAAQDSYFRERSIDIIEVCELLLSLIHGDRTKRELDNPVIIIVPNVLIPSDILNYDTTMIKGIIASNAGPTSHAAILARANRIPLISGVKNIGRRIKSNDEVLVDGYGNCIFVHPHQSKIKAHKEEKQFEKKISRLSLKWHGKVYSKDGIPVKIMANIALPEDVVSARNNGADDIGLVRSEYLYFQYNRMPTFDEQVDYFRSIFDQCVTYIPTVRLLDLGGDKIPNYLKIPKEFNPFMGWRGIRILLKKRDLFKEHLTAIITAAGDRTYSLLIPMVTTVHEWKEAKLFIQHISASLGKPLPKIGILFEVPVALFEINKFFDGLDFASIGTNDLLQYMFAADRNNPNVSYLHNPVDITFLTILRSAITTAHDNGKNISICGEIAGYPLYTILLLGLGLRQFSCSSGTIPLIKEIISRVSISESIENISHLLANGAHSDPVKYLIHLNKTHLEDLYNAFKTYFEPW